MRVFHQRLGLATVFPTYLLNQLFETFLLIRLVLWDSIFSSDFWHKFSRVESNASCSGFPRSVYWSPYRYQLCLSRQFRACERSSASLSQFPVMAAASYVVWANA